MRLLLIVCLALLAARPVLAQENDHAETTAKVELLGSQVQALGAQLAELNKRLAAMPKPTVDPQATTQRTRDAIGAVLAGAADQCPTWATYVGISAGGVDKPVVSCLAKIDDAKKARKK